MTMSIPVLSKKQQKKALSGRKRKNITKNVLAEPEDFKVRGPFVDEKNISEISQVLERLLPSARLPNYANDTSKRGENVKDIKETGKKTKVLTESHLKREQLLVGVNSVSKGVSNETADCVILADDIQPKEQTKRTLGFPCIVLGFKKNPTYFLDVVNLIKSVGQNVEQKSSGKEENVEEIQTEDNVEEENIEKEKTKVSFSYLIRESKNKRVFIPDKDTVDNKNSSNESFIPLSDDTEGFGFENKHILANEVTKGKYLVQHYGGKMSKKVKKESGKIDKFFNKKKEHNIKYGVTHIMKVGANPKRDKKKSFKIPRR